MKKLLIAIILVGAVVTVGGYVWYQNSRPAQQQSPKTEKVTKGRIVEKVSSTGKIAPKDLAIVGIDVPAARIAEVFPKCDVNNDVSQDQPLFRLDDTLAQARLKEAESALENANAAKQQAEAKRDTAVAAVNRAQVSLDAAIRVLERTKKFQKGTGAEFNKSPDADALSKGTVETQEDLVKIAQEGVANAKAAVKEAEAGILAADSLILRAKAGVDVAKKGVEVMTIRSSIAGKIMEKDKRVRVGQVVSAQMSPLFVIAPENLQWELYVQVGQYDIHKIRKGMPVEFTVDAYSDDHSVLFKGTVSSIADLPTTQARGGDLPVGIDGPTFFTVTVDVLSPEEKPADPKDKTAKPHPLRAGLSANVDFTIREVKDVLTVPNAALTYQPERLSEQDQKEINERTSQENNVGVVFLLVNGKEEKMFVRKLATDGTRTAVQPLYGAKLDVNMEVVTEPAPPPTKGGLFERPFKIGLS